MFEWDPSFCSLRYRDMSGVWVFSLSGDLNSCRWVGERTYLYQLLISKRDAKFETTHHPGV